MGFITGISGKAGQKAGSYAPQSTFQAQYKPLEDIQRERYAEKINALESGQGPSVANQYVANAQQNSLAQALAQAASARGGVNPAMAYRNALNAAAQGSQQAVQQGAMMRAQEGIAGQQLAQNYEQLGMQGDLANQNTFMQAQGVNATTAGQNLQAQSGMALQGQKQAGDMMQGVISGASTAMMSDENAKTDISSGGDKIQGFLDAISAKQYKYKDPANGAGTHVSPMAQDLEKTPVGDSMVQDTPQGKVVDYGKGFGAILAAMAHINDRQNQIEGKYAGGTVGMKAGGKVPGKAKVAGDSPKNDTVIAKLSPGEVVIPRSLAEDPERAKKFIEQLKKEKAPKGGYGKVLEAKRKK